jgi:hypothetical protein
LMRRSCVIGPHPTLLRNRGTGFSKKYHKNFRSGRLVNGRAAPAEYCSKCPALEHDPEKWTPVFREKTMLKQQAKAKYRIERNHFALAEMFRQFEPLGLVIGADAAAVKLVGTRQHSLVDQPANDLPVFQDKRHFARAHFQHRA